MTLNSKRMTQTEESRLKAKIEQLESRVRELEDISVKMLSTLHTAYRHCLDDVLRDRNRACGIPVETDVRLTREEQYNLGRELAKWWDVKEAKQLLTKPKEGGL